MDAVERSVLNAVAPKTHVIERTNAKGERFIGTCVRCGKPNLRFVDAKEQCNGNV